MKTKVLIEWDSPNDQNWLNVDNIETALSAHCKNTTFKVTDLNEDKGNSNQMKNAIDKLINRQRLIMKALKLHGIDIPLTCDVQDAN